MHLLILAMNVLQLSGSVKYDGRSTRQQAIGNTMNWHHIRYPEPLHPGDTIGITAPSSGVSEKLHPRLELCIQHLRNQGFKVIEGECLRGNNKHVSAPREKRARDLLALWKNKEVKAILPPWGGELLIHLLPCIDFNELATATPKWLLGYSDTSALLFALTTMTGIATAHGTTLMEMVPGQCVVSQRWKDVLSLRPGETLRQESSQAFQIKGVRWEAEPAAQFHLSEKTNWQCLRRGQPLTAVSFSGRTIGGCMDTLSCLAGTPFGDIRQFAERVERDGIVLYLENVEKNPTDMCRILWNLRLAGWFERLTGLVLGRSAAQDDDAFTYMDALHDVFDDMDIPVIYDADVGHRPPQITIINGALASFTCADGRGAVQLTLS